MPLLSYPESGRARSDRDIGQANRYKTIRYPPDLMKIIRI